MIYTTFESPLGELLALSDGRRLHGLHMQDGRTAIAVRPEWQHSDEPFGELRTQLSDYWAGRRTTFDLPLEMAGTAFQRRVWRALQEIPYGETASYGEIARRVGTPAAARAVGLANCHNPICVVVPCHRVIGADGSLTGFGGGLERKRLLLEHEAGVLALN
jgi:methylated-DNA-[protein]-cysteine S-methyltransferase